MSWFAPTRENMALSGDNTTGFWGWTKLMIIQSISMGKVDQISEQTEL